MKKTLLILCALLFSTTAMAEGGLVLFTNSGQMFGNNSNDAVQFIVTVNTSTTPIYTSQLSATPGSNSTTLHSQAFGTASTFNVSITDIPSGQTQNCLTGVSYNPNWAEQYIYGVCNAQGCTCSLGTGKTLTAPAPAAKTGAAK